MIQESEKQFSVIQENVRKWLGDPKTEVTESERELKALPLPDVGKDPTCRKDEVFDAQTYAGFAYKAELKNPSFGFTKALMDEAFKLKAKRFERTSRAHKQTGKGQFDRMMTRVSTTDTSGSGRRMLIKIVVSREGVRRVLERSVIPMLCGTRPHLQEGSGAQTAPLLPGLGLHSRSRGEASKSGP